MLHLVFDGEWLGKYYEQPDNTRGVTQTLYRTADGRLVVHVEEWSHFYGQQTFETLREVTEADLLPGGRFELPGMNSGFWTPLTLDEALAIS